MKDPLDEIESELRRLRPCQPGDWLEHRIAGALEAGSAPTSVERRWVMPPWWAWLTAATAFCLLLVFGLRWHRRQAAARLAEGPVIAPPQPEVQTGGLRQVKSGNYLVDALEDGVVYASETLPMRRIRYGLLSTSEWRDDRRHLTIRVSCPREEVMLVPMNVH
jgi:hypothetical protein